MQTWMKILALVAVLGLAVADPVKDQACAIDDATISKERSYSLAMDKFKPCFEAAVTTELINEMKEAKSLEDFRKFAKDFCPNVPQVVTCMAEKRATFEHCENKNTSVPFMLISGMVEHLLPGGCENDGDRMAHLTHGAYLLIKKRDTLIPLRKCVHKVNSLIKAIDNADVDLASETYVMHKEAQLYRKCLKHVSEAYKPAVEWFVNEGLIGLKCQHPEDGTLVPCKDVDVSKVTVSNICDMKPLNKPELYDSLEMLTWGCYGEIMSQDLENIGNFTDLEWLKEDYKVKCLAHRQLPKCLLEKSAYAEACLSQEEDKQFQLYVQSIEDLAERSCVEDGARMAVAMHAVYERTAEHGHAMRDCHKVIMGARKAHVGHAISSKNMRLYHEMIAYKQCIVEKLHENNDVSKGMESMYDDVLKKMKCVNPHDGAIVLCETIHEH